MMIYVYSSTVNPSAKGGSEGGGSSLTVSHSEM
jgi:hypothetical protein